MAIEEGMAVDDHVHEILMSWFVGLEWVVVIAAFTVTLIARHYKLFETFPNCVFKWLVTLDFGLALYAGVLRWTPGSPLVYEMGYGKEVTSAACSLVAFGDTFFQTATLYCNTLLIGCIFYMIYFQTRGGFSSQTRRRAMMGLTITSLMFASFVSLGPVHRWLGWCTMDSIGVVIKLLFTCFLISTQMVVLIPTFVIMATGNFETRGVGVFLLFIRFFGLVVFQCVGIIPMVVMEFMAYVRKPIPISLMQFVLVGIPLAQIVNISLLFQKCLPAMFTRCKFLDSSMTLTDSFSRSVESRDGVHGGDKKGGSLRSNRKKGDKKKKKKKAAYRDCELLDKIPFHIQISVVVLLPILLAGGLAAMLALAKQHYIDKANYDHANLKLTMKVADVIHELQHERGRTGEWQGAHGKKYHVEVKEQRELTDKYITEFSQFLDKEYTNGKILTNKVFVTSLGPLQMLDRHREEVTQLKLSTADAVHFYTEAIENFLKVIELMFKYAGSESMDPLIYSSLTYIYHQETMAVEEGWGSIAFAENGWDTPEHNRKFIQLIAGQKASLYLFNGYAEDEPKKMYEEISARPENIEIYRLRKYAQANDIEQMTKYSGQYWYEKMTKKLKSVWEVEDYLASELTRTSDSGAAEAMDEVSKIIVISAVCIIISGLLGLAVTQALQKSQSDGKKIKKCCGMTLSGHVTLHSVISTLVLLTVVVLLINYDADILRSASEVQINMRLRKLMMPVIQELQKERGIVGVYMGSHGEEFYQEKLDQAKKTDYDINELFGYIKGGYYKMPYVEKSPAYKKFIKDLEELPYHREKIHKFEETKDEAMYAYSHTIDDMLHCIASFSVTGLGTKHHINNQLFSLVSLMFAKEMLGDEDAIGSIAFAAGKFEDPDLWIEYVSVVGEVEYFVDYFKTFADKKFSDLHQFYLERDRTQARVYEMRSFLLTQNEKMMEKTEAGHWYGNTTWYMQKYKDVEDIMYEDISHLLLDPIEVIEELYAWLIALFTICTLSAVTVYYHARMDPSAVALMKVEEIVQNVRCECGAKMECGVCHVNLPRGAYAKIGFSSFNAELAGLGHQTRQMLKDGCDYIHLDVMDTKFVPNLSFGTQMIASIRRYNPKAFIVAHMMVEDPEKYMFEVQKAGASVFVFHIETVDDPVKFINKIKDLNMKVGVAVQPETPIDKVLPLVRMVHMVTIMANKQNTGSHNRREFNHTYMSKIKELRNTAPLLDIEVEGGVTFDSIDFCARAGANFVAGEVGHLGGLVGIHKLKRALQKRIYDRRAETKAVAAT